MSEFRGRFGQCLDATNLPESRVLLVLDITRFEIPILFDRYLALSLSDRYDRVSNLNFPMSGQIQLSHEIRPLTFKAQFDIIAEISRPESGCVKNTGVNWRDPRSHQ
jgi:hypothetical protein